MPIFDLGLVFPWLIKLAIWTYLGLLFLLFVWLLPILEFLLDFMSWGFMSWVKIRDVSQKLGVLMNLKLRP